MEKAATFAQACYTLSMACERRLAEMKGTVGSVRGSPKKKQSSKEPWVAAGGVAVHALSDLLFIAPMEVGLAAAEWHSAAITLLNVTTTQDHSHLFWTAGLGEYWREYRAHRRKLIDVVRRNLLTSPTANQDGLWSSWTSKPPPAGVGISQLGGTAFMPYVGQYGDHQPTMPQGYWSEPKSMPDEGPAIDRNEPTDPHGFPAVEGKVKPEHGEDFR